MFDLKRFRKDKRLTQVELADLLGYKQGSISNIERGSFDISPEALDILINKFGNDVRNYISGDINNIITMPNDKDIETILIENRHLKALLEEKERLISVLMSQKDICDIELDYVLDSYIDDNHINIKKFEGKINQRKGIIYLKDKTGEIEVDQFLPKKNPTLRK